MGINPSQNHLPNEPLQPEQPKPPPHREKIYRVRVVILCNGIPKYLWLSTPQGLAYPATVRLVECNADACHFLMADAVSFAFDYRHMQAVIEEVA